MVSRTRTTTSLLLRTLAMATAAVALVSAAGCASSGTGKPFGKTVSPEERAAMFTPANDAYAALGYRHLWTGFPVMTAGAKVNSCDTLGDVIAVQDSAGVLSIIEASSGLMRWTDQLGNPLTKFLGVMRLDNRIICASETDSYLLDVDTGTLVDRYSMLKVADTKPEIVGNILVYGTSAGEIYGQLMPLGFKAWGAYMAGTFESNPARLGDTLGFVSSTGEVLFLDGHTGSGYVRGSMFGGTTVPPAASKDLMFVASSDQSLYAFSPNSAKPVWRHRTDVSLHDRPVYHDGTVYCTIGGEGLTAFTEFGEMGRGKIKWAAKGVSGYVVGIRGGRLLVWDGSDCCLVDPSNGDLIKRAALDHTQLVVTDKFIDGNLYLVTAEGVVAKLAPR